MRLALRFAFIASVIALAAVSTMLIPLDGSLTRVSRAGAADPIDIDLDGTGGPGLFSFGINCDTEMAPGDVCTELLTVRNSASPNPTGVNFNYTIQVWMDDNGADDGAQGFAGDNTASACFNINLQSGPADGLNVGTTKTFGPLAGAFLQPGQSQNWGLEVEVIDDDACQGQSAFIMGFVFATELPFTPTPVPTSTPVATTEIPQVIIVPTNAPFPTSTPRAQVQGVVATPTATRIAQQAGVVVTNLPQTGAGGIDSGGAELWLIALGAMLAALSASLLVANVYVEARRPR